MTHIYISKITSAWSAPRHYLNQCRDIVKVALSNKLQWKIYPSSYTFINENAFDSVVCEISAILSRDQCVELLVNCIHILQDNATETYPDVQQNKGTEYE